MTRDHSTIRKCCQLTEKPFKNIDPIPTFHPKDTRCLGVYGWIAVNGGCQHKRLHRSWPVPLLPSSGDGKLSLNIWIPMMKR